MRIASYACIHLSFILLFSICHNNVIVVSSLNFLEYLHGSNERKEIEKALKTVSDHVEDIPIVIGNEQITTKDVRYQVMV